MKNSLEKFKKFEIEKDKLKDINGAKTWICWKSYIKGDARVSKYSQVKAFASRGYTCREEVIRAKYMYAH